ncbi:SCO family protein [Oceanobacillus caeni]|uniref:Cysteine ABC transporter ATP-binding protein n=1 Tax=Oceanobacillus caeni TaxID=405946 RepID=A0ABR5MFE2_9BACI|nr:MULTISPECIES: SCO family protein [Bacillaceae]KKE79091.1 cysteine ABC transporter ATP-binding protein [Bacilli bacterium VT-13-104]PZD81454.1 SCO family protein [Bacilli bacterium]KPH70247.1 cysteine ABC transporter ATP-binding protein [Oceanobacillus caeni]MCR1836148.1 SCO family protein [Oceanobacillus caeni]MED4476143.1 SCO family protein [Oceanobacillus caeni]
MKFLKFLSLSLFLFLAACGGYPIETNMSQEVANFNFTTQDNESLSLKDLEGEWWIADFIFTNCTTVCLPMTHNMSQLQSKLKEENLDVKLVSFSVDPEFDSPEVLKQYGESYEADFTNWSFLTGYDFDTIKELSIKSFKNLVVEPKEDDQVMHGTSFFLVSPEGEVIKNYSGVDATEIDSIVADLKELN